MPRYMPQDLFDLLIITDLMERLVGYQPGARNLDRLIEGYLQSYPSEESLELKSDIYDASCLSMPTVELIRDMYRAVAIDDSELRAYIFSAIEQIFKTLRKNANAKKSLLRRIFGGTLFNYETRPQVERINRSRENIANAAMTAMTAMRAELTGRRTR
jgi:hypothetical protein